MVWWLAATLARGAVQVEDGGHGCLGYDRVDLEVRNAISDEVVDRVNLLVVLSGEVHWQLRIEVWDADGTIWNRMMEVKPVDCPYLPELVAYSVERGLSELPGWGLPEVPKERAELGFLLSATLPWAVRVGMGGNLWVPVQGAFGWQTQLEGIYSAVEPVRGGGVVIAGIGVGTGPGMALPIRESAVRLSTRIGGGIGGGVGRGLDTNNRGTFPRAVWTTEVGWAFPAALRVAGRAEVLVVRQKFKVDEAGEVEPLVRLGIVLEVAGLMGSGDGGPTERR